MFLADFHVHSNFSDGKHSIPEVVDMFGRRGFGALAITDHLCEEGAFLGKASRYLGQSLTKATFPLYQEILKSEAERAWDHYGMLLIPGMELTKNSVSNHRSAHIVALGITDWIDLDCDFEEQVKQVKELGGLAIAAHPVWTRKFEKQTFHLWDRREEFRDLFDAWEVASGPYYFEEVERSGLPLIATSDLHKKSQMTSWKTVFDCEKTQGAIFQSVRQQQLGFHFYHEVVHEPDFHVPGDAVGFGFLPDSLGNLVRAS